MKATRITIHCTATPNGEARSVQSIRGYHTAKPPNGRGWLDIGYHFLIGIDGTVAAGRPADSQGAGVEGENEDNLHVALVGTDQFTIAQFRGLRGLVTALINRYNIEPWRVYTHNQFESAWRQMKCCPGIKPSDLLYWLWRWDEQPIQGHLLKETPSQTQGAP